MACSPISATSARQTASARKSRLASCRCRRRCDPRSARHAPRVTEPAPAAARLRTVLHRAESARTDVEQAARATQASRSHASVALSRATAWPRSTPTKPWTPSRTGYAALRLSVASRCRANHWSRCRRALPHPGRHAQAVGTLSRCGSDAMFGKSWLDWRWWRCCAQSARQVTSSAKVPAGTRSRPGRAAGLMQALRRRRRGTRRAASSIARIRIASGLDHVEAAGQFRELRMPSGSVAPPRTSFGASPRPPGHLPPPTRWAIPPPRRTPASRRRA